MKEKIGFTYLNKYNLKSFTLTEVIISLLISSIAVSLAMISLLNIKKEIKHVEIKHNQQLECDRFQFLFEKDFQECDSMSIDNNKIYFNQENKTIIYDLLNKSSRKKNDHIDTFSFSTIISDYQIIPSPNKIWIDLVTNKKDSLYFEKEVGIDKLINQNNHGISN